MALNVTIGKEFEEFVARMVASGRYGSAMDVVDNALFYFQEREQHREAKLAALKAEIQKGLDSGPAEEFDPKTLAEDIKRRGRERLATETRSTAKQPAEKLTAENG